MKNNITTNLANCLSYNLDVKQNLSADQLGPQDFQLWKNACTLAWGAFYRYREAVHREAGKGENAKVDATEAFNALQGILDLIGEVNGHPIVKNPEMLQALAAYAMKDKLVYIGEAGLVESQLRNARAYRKTLDFAGVKLETVEAADKEIDTLKDRLNELTLVPGNIRKEKTRNSEIAFRKGVETTIAQIINGQLAKTWEELEAEAEARRNKNKERAKARRQAKRQAEAKAKAIEEEKASK